MLPDQKKKIKQIENEKQFAIDFKYIAVSDHFTTIKKSSKKDKYRLGQLGFRNLRHQI